MASIDVPGLEGMKLAVARINAHGGVLGRPLRLEVRDGGSDLKQCRAAAQELATAVKDISRTAADLARVSEAMALSDRVVVMHAGHILQVGSPQNIYLRPQSRAVARLRRARWPAPPPCAPWPTSGRRL